MRTNFGVRHPALNRVLWCLGLGLALAASGCRDEQAGPKPHARSRSAGLSPSGANASAGRVLTSLPHLTFRSGGSWAKGTVVYLGSRVTPQDPKPGQGVEIAHYFLARAAPPKGYGFFTHVVDAKSGQMLANADHEIQGGALPLENWPVGKVVEDISRLQIPQGAAGALRLVIGFWRGDERLPVDQPAAQDGQNEMLGPVLQIGGAPLPEYHAHKTQHPPVIDGALGDAAWAQAVPVTLHNSFDGSPVRFRTTARILYDDQFLYVAFDAEDPDVWGTLLKRDDPIYTQEVVEIFLDANADGRTYNELEVSPHNTVFDAYFPSRRRDMDTAWDSGMQSAVKVNGTLDNPDDTDHGWTVEMRIPFSHLAQVPHLPPQPNDRWRFNLYRLEHPGRTQEEGQSFSPLFLGDFHNLPRFGWLVFDP